MTREERENALHCLKVMIGEEVCEECNLYGTTGTDHCEADCVRTAIEALEQQPCEDCISRESTMLRVREFIGNPTYTEKMLVDDMNALPSVQPKQIECEDAISREDTINALKNLDDLNGENVFTKNGLYPWNILKELPPVQPKPKVGHWIFDEILDRNYYCSECKSMGVDYWDYCPYCGAKMAEPQESEEARAL